MKTDDYASSSEYELFERRLDGLLNYRGVVRGLDNARVRVCLLANDTDHECFAIDSATHQVIARIIPGELTGAVASA
jgi:hypothetical protein